VSQPMAELGDLVASVVHPIAGVPNAIMSLIVSSTTTSTTTRTATSTTTHPGPGLFCFSVATVNHQVEMDLVRYQYQQKLSIFACDAASVYSDQVFSLQPGDPNATMTIPHYSGLSGLAPMGWMLNVDLFLKVWDLVAQGGAFRSYDVTVKADPDAMFIPIRLEINLQAAPPGSQPWYILNCGPFNSMQGPLEVLSRAAVESFTDVARRTNMCFNAGLAWNKGEDMFMSDCLPRLGAWGIQSFNLVWDNYCGGSFPPGMPCSVAKKVAYHPLKTLAGWQACHQDTLVFGA